MNRFFLLLLGVCLLASCARDFLSGNAPAAAGAARHAKLQISTTSLPTGTVGSSYSATLVATGGTTPYTWSLTSGTLPTGLQLNASTGAITGRPTASTNASELTFTVTDSSQPPQSKAASLTLTVSGTLSITTTSLSAGQVGTPYTATLQASGGITPYTWSISAGTLPAGITLSGVGHLSGTPTTEGISALTFQVTDSSSPPFNSGKEPLAAGQSCNQQRRKRTVRIGDQFGRLE